MDYLDPLPQQVAKVTALSSASNAINLNNIDSIIERLESARNSVASGSGIAPGSRANTVLVSVDAFVKSGNVKAATAHKDWASAVGKLGKDVDKRFTTPLDSLFPPPPPPAPTSLPSPFSPPPPATPPQPAAFTSTTSVQALNKTIALHLARLGLFSTLDTFLDETEEAKTIPPEPKTLEDLRSLHAILKDLRNGVFTSAIEWLYGIKVHHPEVDKKRDLQFALRREEFSRILLAGMDLSGASDPLLPASSPSNTEGNAQKALAYGGKYFRALITPARQDLIGGLLTSTLFLPHSKLLSSPYGHLYSSPPSSSSTPSSTNDPVIAHFTAVYLFQMGLPTESPLSVVVDTGAGSGGAISRILKVGKVMKDKKTAWSSTEELPVEIPLPSHRLYHSIFICPVSKEQATPTNPPMLLPCGHVIVKESLTKLARGTPTVKCPYCPVMSRSNVAVKIYF